MKKQIEMTGINGTFIGFIHVEEIKEANNCYMVWGEINNSQIGHPKRATKLWLFDNISKVDRDMVNKLSVLANMPPILTIQKQLQELGFE